MRLSLAVVFHAIRAQCSSSDRPWPMSTLVLDVELQGAEHATRARFDCDPARARAEAAAQFCAQHGCADEAGARAALAASCGERVAALRAEALQELWRRLGAIVSHGLGLCPAETVTRRPRATRNAILLNDTLTEHAAWRADWWTPWAFGERTASDARGARGREADPKIAQRMLTRAREVEALAFDGELPDFDDASCAAPSDLQRKIGACPLYDGYAALVADAADEIIITDAALAALRGAADARDDTAVAVWETLGTAWFEAEEMEHAIAAYARALTLDHGTSDLALVHMTPPTEETRAPPARPSTPAERADVEHRLACALSVYGDGALSAAYFTLSMADLLFATDAASPRDVAKRSSLRSAMRLKRDAWLAVPAVVAPMPRTNITLSPGGGLTRAEHVVAERTRELRTALAQSLRAIHVEHEHNRGGADEGTLGTIDDPLAELGSTLFHLSHQGLNDVVLMQELVSTLGVIAPSLNFVVPRVERPELRALDAPPPVRVGVLSVHLRDHSIGRIFAQLLMLIAERYGSHAEFSADSPMWKRRRITFHIFEPRSVSPEVAATTDCEDAHAGGDAVSRAIANSARASGGSCAVVARGQLEATRSVVARTALDVLLLPDVGMEPLSWLVAFGRVASVQCVWWGHPSTTGLPSIDYFISLDVEIDESGGHANDDGFGVDGVRGAHARGAPSDTRVTVAHPHYAEQLVRMRVVNTAPYAPAPLGREDDVTLADLGLALDDDDDPDEAHVFVVLGRLFKLGSGFDELARRLLRADPRAVIALIAERHRPWNSRTWLRLRAALADDEDDRDLGHSCGGADWPPLLRRVRFVHYWNYERVLARAVAVLDTYPYGGCLTALEALSHGVPIITMPAPYLRGRFTAAIYAQMGLSPPPNATPPRTPRRQADSEPRQFTVQGESCCVARDADELVSLALRLANDGAHRARVVGSIEHAYRTALHRNEEAADEWAMLFLRAVG